MTADEAARAASGSSKQDGRVAWFFLALAWFATIGAYSLFDPDEGRYAEIPREMWASGDWITPMLNGLPYFEKPILQYWATAALYSVFGVSEVVSRLFAFAMAFACLPLTYWLARGLGQSREIAWRAVFLLAVSPFFILVGHINLLDQSFTFFLLAALTTFLLAQTAAADRRNGLLIVAWVALAAAVLSKGIVALVLTGGTLVLHAIVHRERNFLARIWSLPGFMLFWVIVLPWFVLVEQRNPGFSEFFFLHEHFARFLTKVHHRDGPIWYFVPILLLAMLPAFGTWRAGIVRAWRDRFDEAAFPSIRFLVIWCAFVFVFFSISQSKLPPYLLPVIPPLALLLARAVDDDQRASRRALIIQTTIIFLGVIAMLLFDRRRDGIVDPPVYWACGVSVTAIVVAWALRWWRQPATQHRAWMPVALAAMFAWQGLLAAYAILPPERSSRDLVQDIRAEIRPATRLYSVRQYRHSLSFYLGRSLILVDYKGELEEGLRRVGETTPPRYIDDLRSFVEAWNADRDAVAFIEPDTLADLQALGFSGRRLASDDPRSVVMARR